MRECLHVLAARISNAYVGTIKDIFNFFVIS